MTGRGKSRRLTLGWRKLLLGLGCAGIAVGGVCLARAAMGPPTVQVAAADPSTTPSAGANSVSDSPTNPYSSSFVASFNDGKQGVTREELGEYLIARYGEKLEHLVNRRIIEDACKACGVEVTATEVDQKLTDDLKDLNIDRTRFVKEFLKARGKTLYEWKEDHLRPELMMVKLCHEVLTVSDEEVRNAYEARYGEKVECRVIEWSRQAEETPILKTPEEEARLDKELTEEAKAAYAHIVDNEEAFAEAARRQKNVDLAAGGGKVKAFGRHTLENEELEAQAFALRPGQVSPLIPIKETGGYVAIKCDQRLPANTTIPFEKVSADLKKEVLERKAQKRFPEKFEELKKKAAVQLYLVKKPSDEQAPTEENAPYGYNRNAPFGEAKTRIVASLYDGKVKLTREDLGEYLIKRYGASNLELLVNRRIIEMTCKEQNVTITEGEVEAEFERDWRKKEVKDREQFIKECLAPNKVSVFQYKEDILRPRLMLAKLCRDRVTVEEKDVDDAIEAYYGEKVECRMILWPNTPENAKLVIQEYGKVRDNPQLFEEKARSQASRTLAKTAGLLDKPIGRHTTGNDALEKAIFALQPGEVSNVIGTPEGFVLIKCESRIPPKPVNRAEVRAGLMQEILEKKTEAKMPLYFKELRVLANPRFLIEDPNQMTDLAGQVQRALTDSPPHK